MTNSIDKKLTYEEMSKKINEIGLTLKKNQESKEILINIKKLRINYLLNYDLHTKEEQEKIGKKFEIIDQSINDSIRLNFYKND